MSIIPAGGWGMPRPPSPLTDEELLRTPDPASDHARRLIISKGRTVRRIVRVYCDAILFVDAGGRAVTAWLWPVKTQTGPDTTLSFETGFPAEPSRY